MPHLLASGIDDSRTLGQKFRRVELQQVLVAEDKWEDEFADLPKESLDGACLLDVVRSKKIDLRKYVAPDGSFIMSDRKLDKPMDEVDLLKAQLANMQKTIEALQSEAVDKIETKPKSKVNVKDPS